MIYRGTEIGTTLRVGMSCDRLDLEHTRKSLGAVGSTSTLDSAGKAGQIRILAPSGDHFEITVTSSMRILDVKTEIFNSWPKGNFQQHCSYILTLF